MKILLCHNKYVFPGGEDSVAAAEADMLRDYGEDVRLYETSNQDLSSLSLPKKITFYLRDFYFSQKVYQDVSQILADFQPDVVHVHNSFYAMGPALYQACFDANIPVVQSLHNYRLMCIAATFFRDGHVCEDCTKQGFGAGIRHRCWKDSRAASYLLTRLIQKYRRDVVPHISKFIAVTEFSQSKFIENGFDETQFEIKPNFLPDLPEASPIQADGHFLCVGALQPYKGLHTLLSAAHQTDVALTMIGSGPLENIVKKHRNDKIAFLGQCDSGTVIDHMRNSFAVIMPSECYENFPRVIVEAFACGRPVVASRLGAMAELIDDGVTGLLFEPGNVDDLAQKVTYLKQHPQLAQEMGENARKLCEQKYTKETNYQILKSIYQSVLPS